MATYGGFTAGSYQDWSLNLITDIFCTSGIARGMQVTQAGTPNMTVLVTVDATALDGVCILPNGCWVRIDQTLTLNVPSNSSGSTRTDAVVAAVDPVGNTFSLTYITNWASGLSGANNQFVLCLVSVANGASQILNSNITMNSASAKFGNAGGAANSMQDPDGIGFKAIDNSSSATLLLAITGTSAGSSYRSLQVEAIDISGIAHYFTFDSLGNFTSGGNVAASGNKFILDPSALNGESAGSLTISGNNPGGGGGNADIYANNPTGGWFYFNMKSGTTHIDQTGVFSGPATYEMIIDTSNNTTQKQRFFIGTVQPTTATNGDVWIDF